MSIFVMIFKKMCQNQWHPFENVGVWKRLGNKTYQSTSKVKAEPPDLRKKIKCVMMLNSTFCKIVFPHGIVIFQTVSTKGFQISQKQRENYFYKKCYSTLSSIFHITRESEDDQFWQVLHGDSRAPLLFF